MDSLRAVCLLLSLEQDGQIFSGLCHPTLRSPLDLTSAHVSITMTQTLSVPPQHPRTPLTLVTFPVSLVLPDRLSWLFHLPSLIIPHSSLPCSGPQPAASWNASPQLPYLLASGCGQPMGSPSRR